MDEITMKKRDVFVIYERERKEAYGITKNTILGMFVQRWEAAEYLGKQLSDWYGCALLNYDVRHTDDNTVVVTRIEDMAVYIYEIVEESIIMEE